MRSEWLFWSRQGIEMRSGVRDAIASPAFVRSGRLLPGYCTVTGPVQAVCSTPSVTCTTVKV
jgi:hypothetical protein